MESKAIGEEGEIAMLPPKKRGRQVLLDEESDIKVQMYLKYVREGGVVVSARIVLAAARGFLLMYDRSMLAEYGRHVELKVDWAYSLLHQMKCALRKVKAAKSKHAVCCRIQ